MNVLVNTPIGRELLRISFGDGQAQLVGVVRQELLSEIREEKTFRKLRDYSRAFDGSMGCGNEWLIACNRCPTR